MRSSLQANLDKLQGYVLAGHKPSDSVIAYVAQFKDGTFGYTRDPAELNDPDIKEFWQVSLDEATVFCG